jgi:hypothetical protein
MVCLSYQSDFEAGRNSCTAQGNREFGSAEYVPRTLTEFLGFSVLQVFLEPGFYPPAKCGVIALA